MKKIFFFAFAAFAALVSCNKQDVKLSTDESHNCMVTVTIRGTDAETKTVGNIGSNETKVNNLQVFAFNGNNLEDYASTNNSLTATLAATTGSREIWAIVNAPSLASIRSKTALQAATSMLSDNAVNNFVMIGSTTQELNSANNESNPVAITVKRVVSRVSLQQISANFQLTMSEAYFEVQKIYLINVVGSQTYSIGATSAWVASPSTWLNQLAYVASGADALIYDAVTSTTVKNSQPATLQHDFYPYPNAIGAARTAETAGSPKAGGTNVYSASWSPRQTMLVIEGIFHESTADVTGTAGYYPVDLPAMERNKTYVIENITFTRRPSDNPYEPVMTGQSWVQISVHDWETGLSLGTIEC